MTNSTLDAINSAEAGASDAWKAAAIAAVKEVAQSQKTFTTDAVWAVLARKRAFTHEHRALGPIMVRAKKMGYAEILSCDTCGTKKVMAESVRPEAHSMDVAVYRSLLV